jgi:hypothetical protein
MKHTTLNESMQSTWNIRHALILIVTMSLFLMGYTTTRDERQVERLMGHRDWPRIQQVAEAEVKRREILWPDTASYVPVEHEDKVWVVSAMTGSANGDVQRVVTLMIGDDGGVMAYKRNWEGGR